MFRKLALVLAAGLAFSSFAADSVNVTVKQTQIEVRYLEPLSFKYELSSASVTSLCREKFGTEWVNAPALMAKLHDGSTKDVGTYYGDGLLLYKIDQVLKARLGGSTGESMYVFMRRTTLKNGKELVYGWHYYVDKKSGTTQLVLPFHDGPADVYCARLSKAE